MPLPQRWQQQQCSISSAPSIPPTPLRWVWNRLQYSFYSRPTVNWDDPAHDKAMKDEGRVEGLFLVLISSRSPLFASSPLPPSRCGGRSGAEQKGYFWKMALNNACFLERNLGD